MSLKFKEYITEAIGIETVKKALVGKPIWDYKTQLTEEFGGKYRKIIGRIEPDIEKDLDEHPIYNILEKMFLSYGYVVTKEGYIKGYVTKDKQQYKIGKLLRQFKDKGFEVDFIEELMNSFRDDPLRQTNRKPYLVVVSKHPYDVMGASTDRNWTSCVNLGGGIIYNKAKTEDEKEKGMNADRLLDSLHTPFMVAYLVDPDDKNTQDKIMIQRPLSRILIYPFKAKSDEPWNDEGFDFNWSIGDVYGLGSENFKSIVYDWVQELNETYSESERFERMSDVYYDSFDESLVRTYMDLEEIEEWFDQNVNKENLTIGSIEEDWLGDHSRYYIFDLKLENFIDKEHFEHEIMQDKYFFDNFFIPAIREMLMGSYFSRVYEELDDLDIYRIYDNTGTIHMHRIPVRGLPPYLEQEWSEEELLEEHGPNGLFYIMLDFLRKYSMNDVGVEQSNVDSNLSGYFEDFERMVGEKLLENDIDPVIKNWRELDGGILEEIHDELLMNFQM